MDATFFDIGGQNRVKWGPIFMMSSDLLTFDLLKQRHLQLQHSKREDGKKSCYQQPKIMSTRVCSSPLSTGAFDLYQQIGNMAQIDRIQSLWRRPRYKR